MVICVAADKFANKSNYMVIFEISPNSNVALGGQYCHSNIFVDNFEFSILFAATISKYLHASLSAATALIHHD
jgi:hypothetical protein